MKTPLFKSRKAVGRSVAAVLLLLVILGATGSVYIYYSKPSTPTASTTTQAPVSTQATSQSPVQFTFSAEPSFFHAAPGGGAAIRVLVNRSPGFSAAVRIELVNPPSWVISKTLTLNVADSNATLLIGVAQSAPKAEVPLTVRASAQGSKDQLSSLDLKVVSVSTVTSKYGGAIVYETTKVLDSETLKALTSYSAAKVVFSRMTAQLQGLDRGDVISASPTASPLVPGGIFLTVLAVRQEEGSVLVESRQATLIEAVQEIQIGRPASPPASASGGGIAPSVAPQLELGDAKFTIYDKTFGFDWTNIASTGYAMAKADLAIQVYFIMNLHVKWDGLRYAYMHVGATETGHVSLKGNADSDLTLGNSGADHVNLGEFYNSEIDIIPGILWISVTGTWEGRASGHLAQNVNMDIAQNFYFQAGPLYDADDGLYFWCKWGTVGSEPAQCSSGIDLSSSVQKTADVKSGSGSNARIGIGPRLQVDLNAGLWEIVKGSAGGSVSANLFVEFDSDKSKKPSWWVDGGIGEWVSLNLGLSLIHGLYSYTKEWSYQLPDMLTFRLLNGGNFPPDIKITAPQDGATLDLSTNIISSVQFTATATDFEDGDLCSKPSSVVWWSDVDGKLGTGCSIGGLGAGAGAPVAFKTSVGARHITVTVTDSDGSSTTSAPITFNIVAPGPAITIVSPKSGTYYTGPLLLQGSATSGLGSVPCDQLTWYIYLSLGNSQVLILTLQGGVSDNFGVCTNDQAQIDTAGNYHIVLEATNNYGVKSGEFVDITVQQVGPTSPLTVRIIQPANGTVFVLNNGMINLVGWVPSDVHVVTSTWYAHWFPKTCSFPYCLYETRQVASNGGNLAASYPINSICSDATFTPGYHVFIQLDVVDEIGRSGAAEADITLLCQKLASSLPPDPNIGLQPSFILPAARNTQGEAQITICRWRGLRQDLSGAAEVYSRYLPQKFTLSASSDRAFVAVGMLAIKEEKTRVADAPVGS